MLISPSSPPNTVDPLCGSSLVSSSSSFAALLDASTITAKTRTKMVKMTHSTKLKTAMLESEINKVSMLEILKFNNYLTYKYNFHSFNPFILFKVSFYNDA